MFEAITKPSFRLVVGKSAYTICFLFVISILVVAMKTLAGALGDTFLSYIMAIALVGAITVLSLYVLMTWHTGPTSPLPPAGSLAVWNTTDTERRVA